MRVNEEKLKTLTRQVDSYNNGSLIIKSGFKPIDVKNGIDWDYRHSNNQNTYQTYLHSLNFIKVFTELAGYNKDKYLMKKTRNIIMDWNKKNRLNNENYAWAEHPAASRIINIIYFQEHAPFYKLKKNIFDSIIMDHCKFLSDEKNYKMNNHGLMMDNALLKAADYIEDIELSKVYKDKALYRVRLSMYRDFSRRGIHLENSPEYHRMVVIIYKKIMSTLKTTGTKLDSHFKNLYKMAEDFKAYVIKPNMEYPMLGDTGQIKEKNIVKRFSNIVDYDAGLAILQRKSKGNLIDSTYLTFKCGYQSKTHKHLDDLSLTYYLNGHDLFIDPGKYSYDIKDPIREYLISPEAHTTISIKGKNYKLSNPFIDTNSLRITKYYSTTNYRIITGINKLYENVVINRTLIITNEPVVIVIDRVVANNTEIINQNFNINPQAKIIKSSDEQYEIKINKSSYILETLKINNRKITSKIKDGFVSYKFADYSKNKRVVFEQINKSSTFVTHIAEKNIKIKNISFENKVLSFTCNDKSYNIDL
ncbi:heparinase II/III domain-containing protein [Jeotgalicoccus sp. FSL K6-3177]|uniref:heparinase II/III domain-containing protein n=1 Tax=Jeotgalicoccus sp. FSL K6-3177 TaxID=2921494 RepID=UPI0030FDD32A